MLCLAACARAAGTFSVSFGFIGEKPDPQTQYNVFVRVKDAHGTTVAESPSAVFDPDTRLHFPSVRNGDAYTIVVELHTVDNDRIAYFGRSKPFDLQPGQHADVQVDLEIQTVPRGSLLFLWKDDLDANVRSKVNVRKVPLAFTAFGATEATLANDEKFNRGKATRTLTSLHHNGAMYFWDDWDLDAEICDEPPCADGEREVYLQLTNSAGYHSEPARADIELDTTPPEITSQRIDPTNAADGVITTLQVIASEPLAAVPDVSVVPADFTLTPHSENNVPGQSFSFSYTVDAQALDQQAYQFKVKLVDIAGNENEVELGNASELRIESELRALSASIERIPTFAPFASLPVFSRTDPVTGEPVHVRVTVESSRPYDDAQLHLIAQDKNGHALAFEYVAAHSDKTHAVFTRALTADDAAGSYQLQLDWRDRSGRVGDPEVARAFTISDAPKDTSWGAVDSSLDDSGEPRTLYTARPWGALTANGHNALGDSLRGRVIQHAQRAEDRIAQLLIYGDASSDGTPRPASLLSVAEVKTESSTFDVTFNGHSDYHLYVVPVAASGHRGPVQAIAHSEWVATLPEAVSGGTAAYPHQLLSHMLPPTLPLTAAEQVRLPANSSEVPYAGSWERRRADLVRPESDSGSVTAAVYDPNRGRTLLVTGDLILSQTAVWQWDGSTWSVSRSSNLLSNAYLAATYDRARDRFVSAGGGHWSDAHENGGRSWIDDNNTWEWDGSEWSQLHPGHELQAKLSALAYDPSRRLSVGVESDGSRTWEWDGVDWVEGAAFPTVEKNSSLRIVYDEARKCLVAVASTIEGTRTFEYTQAQWVERTSQQTPPGFSHTFVAFDSVRNRVIVYGTQRRLPQPEVASDLGTWQWDGVDWSEVTSSERPSRCFAMLEEGVGRGVSLLCGRGSVSERWRLGPNGWSPVTLPTAPPGRANASMAYDERRKRVVLFGGDSGLGTALFQTWELDGASWHEVITPSVASTGVSGATRSMTYDAARGVSIYLSPHARNNSDDENEGSETLVFDGVSWKSVSPTPELAARMDYAITYDATRERTVVFGGSKNTPKLERLADTWEWDGNTWLQAQPETSPAPRQDHAMVFDSARKYSLLFGGSTGQGYAGQLLDDTWAWDGRAWTQLSPTQSPPARSGHALAFDPERGRVVLFGGLHRNGDVEGNLADTWEWDGSTWTQVVPGVSPRPRANHTMTYDPERKRVLLFGGVASNDAGTGAEQVGDLWSWDGTNWVQLQLDSLPSLQARPSLAYDPERKQTVMFGGAALSTAGQQATSTWIWDGEQWLRKTVPAPSTRLSAAVAFDPHDRRLMLYGGMISGNATVSDTWTWDGATWSQLIPSGPADGDPKLYWSAMMYDSARDAMLLVTHGRTSTWKDNAWQLLGSAGDLPETLSDLSMDYDVARQRGVLNALQFPVGGGTGSRVAFEWDGSRWQSREPSVGVLAYDTHRRRLVQLNDEYFIDSNYLSDVEASELHTLVAPTSPLLYDAALAYDDARRQLLLVGMTQKEPREMQTWVWSSFVPAHEVMIDLKPLFGAGRTTDVVLDGFAFRATGGASAATEDVANPGVALELWNGQSFARVLENDASDDANGELCFESHDPATLGALEVDKRWPFVLRPAADSDGPEPPKLKTNGFEVRVRFHLRGAAPALAPEPGSIGKRCASDSWALRDMRVRP